MIVHIASDFPNQSLYTELVVNLEIHGFQQRVYSAVRTAQEAAWKSPMPLEASIYIEKLLNPFDRIFYSRKIKKIINWVEKSEQVNSIRLTHAHTLYSDGGVAYELKKKYGIPYIVAVRNTDLNAFMRLRPDLAGYRDQILTNARKIIFLSPAYREAVLEKVGASIANTIKPNVLVIPNGIASHWLSDQSSGLLDMKRSDTLKLLYVGDLSVNKNLKNLFIGIEILSKNIPVQLTVVGGTSAEADQAGLKDVVGRRHVTFKGRIKNGPELKAIYRQHDIFVMPSLTETFGLVYIEALSQGLPVVHSRGQGIAGFFSPQTVSECADPNDPKSIAAAIQSLANRSVDIHTKCINEAQRFNWPAIAAQYSDIYRAI
jgi:glycosyltransferase involved in cell wall biosynthesis